MNDSTRMDSLQCGLDDIRQRVHGHCIACGSIAGHEPRLRFTPVPNGGVRATFCPHLGYEGYNGILHGGVTATLLDAAMTNCLFAHKRCAVTAELHVRYRRPVVIGVPCVVTAWITRSVRTMFVLGAEIAQNDQVCATAEGKFMECTYTGEQPTETERNINVQGAVDQGSE